ncbi:MAG: hypothetical protein MUC28_04380 [Planctomycetes bacterium]|jgi:hypothetical protein|nr:hypothetical protein [Planctomycetota bacterium]
MNKTKALVLFSGGLDSLLAAVILQKQGIEADAVCFTSSFFSSAAAQKAAKAAGFKLTEHDISRDILQIVKNPPSGYGKHLNPCIDCHALMIKRAGKIKKQGHYDVIATGEVLGQRPFSQTKEALIRIEKIAGAEILRPLSAKLLPPTAAEEQGLVKRHKLYDISGRSRERQLALAEEYGLKAYSTPAGGCLLTDPEFSGRLLKMLDFWPECGADDIGILKHGRYFWLKRKNLTPLKPALLMIGRRETDNLALSKLAKKGDYMLELKEIAGPTSLLRGIGKNVPVKSAIIPLKLKLSALRLGENKAENEIMDLASLLTGYYAPKARGREVALEIKQIT